MDYGLHAPILCISKPIPFKGTQISHLFGDLTGQWHPEKNLAEIVLKKTTEWEESEYIYILLICFLFPNTNLASNHLICHTSFLVNALVRSTLLCSRGLMGVNSQ